MILTLGTTELEAEDGGEEDCAVVAMTNEST